MFASLRRTLFGGRRDAAAAAQGSLLLLVDDDEDLRGLLRVSLEGRGYRILEAANGDEGLRLAAAERPNLIVLDANMPKLGGFEALRALKQRRGTAGIPVIMLTRRWQQGDVVTGLGMGAADFLTKPVAVEELVRSIEKSLRT